MGHRLEKKVPVNEAMKVEERLEGYSIPLFFKGVVGIAIIFGISGILFWWKVRKSTRNINGRA